MTIAQRLNQLHAGNEQSAKAKAFIDVARIVACSRGNSGAAKALVHDHRIRLSPIVKTVFDTHHQVYTFDPGTVARQKAAAAAGTTAASDWALPLAEYQTLAGAFLESLRNFSAFDAMLPAMRRVPFRTRIGAVTSGATGTTVSQASVKPISRLTLAGNEIDERKAVAILVITDELARFSNTVAGNLFATELSNAVAVETDNTFATILILNAPLVGSGGATAEHVLADLRAMLAAITTGQRSQLFLLMRSAIAKTLSVLNSNTGAPAFPTLNYNGGSIAGITVLVTDGAPANTMILADASQIAAASETIQLSATNEAAVQMDTVGDSPISASTPMLSLWQNNLTGLRAERFFGVEKLVDAAAVVLTGVAYTGDSPGP